MYVVMGATGHVGGATLQALLDASEEVVAVTHDPAKTDDLERLGARAVIADATDASALHDALALGSRALLLNPPAAPSTDTDAVEEAQVRAIVDAVRGANLDKVVIASTSGARPGRRIGDLTVLHHLEEGVAATGVPTAVNRGGYYYSNFDAMLAGAREGVLPSFFLRI